MFGKYAGFISTAIDCFLNRLDRRRQVYSHKIIQVVHELCCYCWKSIFGVTVNKIPSGFLCFFIIIPTLVGVILLP